MTEKINTQYRCDALSDTSCMSLAAACSDCVSDVVAAPAVPLDAGVCLSVSEAVSTAYRCVKGIAWRFAKLCITVKGILTGALRRLPRSVYRNYVRVRHCMVKAWSMLCCLRL